MNEPIEFDELAFWLRNADVNPARIEVKIARSRFAGNHRDFASGLIEARLESPFGEMLVTCGWSAFAQVRRGDGWYVELRPDAKGQALATACPVAITGQEVVIPLDPAGEDLRGLAHDFWSYQDLAALILPLLPL